MSNILVIEDEPTIQRILVLILSDQGHEVSATTDGEAGLTLLEEHRPDLIIADVRLTGMDGVEFTRRVKSNPEYAGVPVLLMSAYGRPPVHQADRFISKPFDIDELIQHVSQLLEP